MTEPSNIRPLSQPWQNAIVLWWHNRDAEVQQLRERVKELEDLIIDLNLGEDCPQCGAKRSRLAP